MSSISEARIDRLVDEGKILFIYSDKYNFYVIFHKKEDNRLYRIIAHKDYEIDCVEPIDTPEDWCDCKSVKFFKPYVENTGNIIYVGIMTSNDNVSRKFTIENDEFLIKELVEFAPAKQFNMLNCLKHMEIVSHVQKKNRLFFVGKDIEDGGSESVYGVVDLEKDQFDQIYYLYSDKGQIHLNSVNIDTDTLLVSIAGYFEAGNLIKPYLETLLLRK